MEDGDDAARVRFFPPGIPLITIFSGIVLDQIWPTPETYAIAAPFRYYLGGTIALSAILLLGLWSVLLFRKGGQSENPWKPTLDIVDRGPYRITRNPMYLQMIVVCVGVAIALANGWILLLTPLAIWALQTLVIRPEEAYLEAKFGETYVTYKRNVRRWI